MQQNEQNHSQRQGAGPSLPDVHLTGAAVETFRVDISKTLKSKWFELITRPLYYKVAPLYPAESRYDCTISNKQESA